MGDKDVGDLIQGVSLEWNDLDAKVLGTLKHVTDYQDFSTIPEEQEGNYFPVTIDRSYTGQPITVEKTGASPKTAIDLNWIIRIPDKSTKVTVKKGNVKLFTLDFSNADLQQGE